MHRRDDLKSARLVELALFVFTMIFESQLLGKLRQAEQLELNQVGNNLQGVMV